ncbi:ComF family protein [Bordetella sp. 02P26C-1]|uniref:ComF family protein n=1 Tax=Bordetella sp. 02P26C-1 TaxID=2683195 RepID=UPI0013529739|nr:phosphoribosyltransferase family protein [Bordetella sp. 02P26C-1]MVW79336.1 ComF family protein [Bordetella sp. 02P26C-1]
MLSIIADSRGMFFWRRMVRGWRDWIPTDCPLCEGKAAGARLCAGCAHDITQAMREAGPRCARCAQRGTAGTLVCRACAAVTPNFESVIAAFDYEAPFDSLIARYKTEHRFGLSTTLAHLLAQAVAHAGGLSPWQGSTSASASVLVPIPSSAASLRRRGFNPAGELAASLGAELHLPVRRDVLRRRREGPRQAYSGRAARHLAAQGLFETVGRLEGWSVGLVDDVMTTGATVNAASAALLRAGAARVVVLVAARTPWRQPPTDGAEAAAPQ